MVAALLVCALALRLGSKIRRARQGLAPRDPSLRARHLRLAKPGVAMVAVGFVGGPLSMLLLRGREPFGTFHALLGTAALALFLAAAVLGRRLERGRGSARDAHALLAVLAVLFAAAAAVAGFVLLP
jgi:hypothetical protein